MSASGTTRVRLNNGRVAILLDKPRLTLRSRARVPKIDDVRNPLIAHAAIDSPGKARLFKEHAL